MNQFQKRFYKAILRFALEELAKLGYRPAVTTGIIVSARPAEKRIYTHIVLDDQDGDELCRTASRLHPDSITDHLILTSVITPEDIR